jgi:hypothetical protein
MSDPASFWLYFWLPLGVGLALFLTWCTWEQKLRSRLLVMLGFIIVWTTAFCIVVVPDAYQHASYLWANLGIAVFTIGPTFVVSWIGYEITSKVSQSTWIRVGVSTILGVPMVVLSVVFCFGTACTLVGDCL